MATLTKLHIRTIQTINSGTLSILHDEKLSQKFDALYIANASSIYLANTQGDDSAILQAIKEDQELKLSFKKELVCEGTGKIVSRSDEAFEDMSLFFHLDASKISQVIVFDIVKIY